MGVLQKGRYVARFGETPQDLGAAQRLRQLAFDRPLANQPGDGGDVDSFDPMCRHILVEEMSSGTLVCCFRFLALNSGRQIEHSYAAQYYELSALREFDGPMVEIGRFCMHPDWHDPDILRQAWGAMTRYVDDHNVEMLFGCSSFSGTNANEYLDSFAMLKARHLAPKRWLPRVKAPQVFRFASRLQRQPDMKQAMLRMPPLLRTYLMMGGWVSDHAVIDRRMNTLHVFTGLEIRAIPDRRKRFLRAMTG